MMAQLLLALEGVLRVVVFITDFGPVDRIIDHLNLRYVAAKTPPFDIWEQVALPAADDHAD